MTVVHLCIPTNVGKLYRSHSRWTRTPINVMDMTAVFDHKKLVVLWFLIYLPLSEPKELHVGYLVSYLSNNRGFVKGGVPLDRRRIVFPTFLFWSEGQFERRRSLFVIWVKTDYFIFIWRSSYFYSKTTEFFFPCPYFPLEWHNRE